MVNLFQGWSQNIGLLQRLVTLILLLVATVVILAACAGKSTPTSEQSSATTSPQSTPSNEPEPMPSSTSGAEQIAKGPIATELAGIMGWINTEPFTLNSLRGKVVLIDFWTYTCVNCIRTLPFLKEWHEKYADQGLVIVGVHSPEFEFERVRENVEAAAAQYDLRWPIVQDNSFSTWKAYENRYWPTKYLIDKDGVIRYTHIGEGAYETTEEKIRELLTEIGAPIHDIPVGSTSEPERDPLAITGGETRQTRELYAGYLRNDYPQPAYIGNSEYYSAPPRTPLPYTGTREITEITSYTFRVSGPMVPRA